jgi:hypothetical protein
MYSLVLNLELTAGDDRRVDRRPCESGGGDGVRPQASPDEGNVVGMVTDCHLANGRAVNPSRRDRDEAILRVANIVRAGLLGGARTATRSCGRGNFEGRTDDGWTSVRGPGSAFRLNYQCNASTRGPRDPSQTHTHERGYSYP